MRNETINSPARGRRLQRLVSRRETLIKELKAVRVAIHAATCKKPRPKHLQRIIAWSRHRIMGECVYYERGGRWSEYRAHVEFSDGGWASWNYVKRWKPANADISNRRE